MKATRFLRFFVAIALVFSLVSPVFAIDATSAPRAEITPKSPVPTGTVATWPMDAAVPPGWLACNGQAVPSSYPELRALMGSVPNYNSRQFLRGATSGAGSSVADSTRSHTHVIPAHSHTVSGSASSQAVTVGSQTVSGTAEGQRYIDSHTGIGAGGMHGVANIWSCGGEAKSLVQIGSIDHNKVASSSTITGRTSGGSYNTAGGTITGWTNSVANISESTGGSETAPMHTLVKYIIKAD